MLAHRVLTAVVGIPLALLVVYVGGWWLAALVTVIALGGLRELYRLLAARERAAYGWLGYPLALVLLAAVGLSTRQQGAVELPALEAALVVAAMSVAGAWLVRVGPPPASAAGTTFTTLAAHIYVPQLLSYVVRLRALGAPAMVDLGVVDWQAPAGVCWLVLVLATVWGMDTAAYAVGKTLGEHRLCPTISPGKTVEGAIGALVAAAALAAGLGHLCGLAVHFGIALGLAIGLLGQMGDLFESLLKRRAGVKDSGALLPGHGGILDRFDSLLFVAPAAYFLLRVATG